MAGRLEKFVIKCLSKLFEEKGLSYRGYSLSVVERYLACDTHAEAKETLKTILDERLHAQWQVMTPYRDLPNTYYDIGTAENWPETRDRFEQMAERLRSEINKHENLIDELHDRTPRHKDVSAPTGPSGPA